DSPGRRQGEPCRRPCSLQTTIALPAGRTAAQSRRPHAAVARPPLLSTAKRVQPRGKYSARQQSAQSPVVIQHALGAWDGDFLSGGIVLLTGRFPGKSRLLPS